jgi:hypothetical protein
MPLNTDKELWDTDKDTIVNPGSVVNKGEIEKGKSEEN